MEPTGRGSNAAPAEQDQRLAAEISEWERVLTAARDDADVQALLGPAEFDTDALDLILADVDSAGTAYTARAKAIGAQKAAQEAKDAAYDSARSSYRAFRKMARSRFQDDADALAALGLNDPTARALDPFVTQARAGYGAASDDPYLSRFGRGYTAERLAALIGEVDALVDAEKALTRTDARAGATTTTRDAEAAAARKAFGDFRTAARVLLPDELLARIGLD